MSIPLITIVSVIYLFVAASEAHAGWWPIGVVFFFYALSNVGFIVNAWRG